LANNHLNPYQFLKLNIINLKLKVKEFNLQAKLGSTSFAEVRAR